METVAGERFRPGSVLAVADGLGLVAEAGVQALPDLIRGVGPALALGAHDNHSGRRDTRGSCQAEYFPPPHTA